MLVVFKSNTFTLTFELQMTLSGHHPRFEAFLKRTLDEAQYEKIRTIESCIVDSVLEKKSFQVVVVDCDGISLENCVPWKVIHFLDVISVELVSGVELFPGLFIRSK